jgi:hypothetical protein
VRPRFRSSNKVIEIGEVLLHTTVRRGIGEGIGRINDRLSGQIAGASASPQEALSPAQMSLVFHGSETGVAAYIGKRTRVVDVANGMLLPGFIDSHAHITASETLPDAALTFRGQPPAVVVAELKRYVEDHPDEPIIRGGGWIYEAFPSVGPTKEMIDPFIPDRPAVLKAGCGIHCVPIHSNMPSSDRRTNATAMTAANATKTVRALTRFDGRRGKSIGLLIDS